MIRNLREYIYSLMTDKKKGLFCGFCKAILLLFSFIYLMGVEFTKFLYAKGILKKHKVACKVISVGNITMGGTGKTPIVEFLMKKIEEKGKKVVVLLRGYGNDEHKMLKQNLKTANVMVGRDRVKNAKQAIKELRPDVILLDDGFQHWRIERDIDIVLVNSRNPFGNGKLLPRGILREPLSSLKRADIFLLNKVDDGKPSGDVIKKIKELNPDAGIYVSHYKPVLLYDFSQNRKMEIQAIRGKRICAVSAIADPEYFEKMLKDLGAAIDFSFRFSDHHDYTLEDLEQIIEKCKDDQIHTIVTTQKDVVKINGIVRRTDVPILALHIEPEIEMEEELLGRLYSVISG